MERVTRICLTGPESTGKSQLARRLARELGTLFVPEYAREYAEARHNRLSRADVEPIARGQMAAEERRLPEVANVIVLDTDLISTIVYARLYYASCPRWIEEEAWRRRADLYLLMDTDVEWQPDGARDASGDLREDLFDSFRAALDEFETRWTIISGLGEQRWNSVRDAVRRLL